METVAFYCYKGGAGCTQLVANTAGFLAKSGRRVVVLDLDLEAPGLHHKLGNLDVLRNAQAGTLRGTVDLLLGVLEGDHAGQGVRQVAIEVIPPSDARGSLMLIPAGSAPSQTYWAALERLNAGLRSTRRSGGLLEAVLEIQERVAGELAPDFLLIDARSGITELGGLATSVLADRVVCLTTTAPESVEGTLVVANALRMSPRLGSKRPLQLDFLITRVPPGSDRSGSVAVLAGKLGAAAVLPHEPAVASQEQAEAGDGLFATTLDWIARTFPVPRH